MESRSGDSDKWGDIESRLDRVLDGDADSLLDESLDALRSLTDESAPEIDPEKRFDLVDPAEDPNSQFSEVMRNLTRMGEDPALPPHTVSAYPPSPYLGRPWTPTAPYVHPEGTSRTGYVHEPGPGVPRYVHPAEPAQTSAIPPAAPAPPAPAPTPRPTNRAPAAAPKRKFSESREPEDESLLPRSDEVLWAPVSGEAKVVEPATEADVVEQAPGDEPEIDSIFESLVNRSKREAAEAQAAGETATTADAPETEIAPQPDDGPDPAAHDGPGGFFSTQVAAPPVPAMVKPPGAITPPGPVQPRADKPGAAPPPDDVAASAETSTLDRFASFPGAGRSRRGRNGSPPVVDDARTASTPPDDASPKVERGTRDREIAGEAEANADTAIGQRPTDPAPAGEDTPAPDSETTGSGRGRDADHEEAATSEAERRFAKRFNSRNETPPGSMASAGLLNVTPGPAEPKTTTRAFRPGKGKGDRKVVPAGTTPHLVPQKALPKNAPTPDVTEPTAPGIPAASAPTKPPTPAPARRGGSRNRAKEPHNEHPTVTTADDSGQVPVATPEGPAPTPNPFQGLGPSRKVAGQTQDDVTRPDAPLPVAAGGVPLDTEPDKSDKSSRRVRGHHAPQMPDTQPQTSEELAISLEEPRRGLGYVAGLALLLFGLAAVGWVLISSPGDDKPAFQTDTLPASLTTVDADVVALSINRCDEQGVGGTLENSIDQQIFVDLQIRFVADSGVQFHDGNLQSQAIDAMGTSEYSFNYIESLVPNELRGLEHRCEVEVTRAAAADG